MHEPNLNTKNIATLERCNRDNVQTLELIVGVERDSVTRNGSATSKELKARGHHWAQHVLEAPRSWILCAVCVLVTVGGRGLMVC